MPRKTELLVLLPVVAVMLAAGVGYHVLAQNAAREAAQQRLDTTAQLTSELVSRRIDTLDSILQNTLAQQALENYQMFRDADLLDEAEQERHDLEQSLINATAHDKAIVSISIFDKQGDRFVGVNNGQRTLEPKTVTSMNCKFVGHCSNARIVADDLIQIWHCHRRRGKRGFQRTPATTMAVIEYRLSSLAGEVSAFVENHLEKGTIRILDSEGNVRYRHGDTIDPRNQPLIAAARVPIFNGTVEIVHDQEHALTAFYQSETTLFLALTGVTALVVTMTAFGTRYVTRELHQANAKLEANQESLREMTERAKSASRAKSDFLANMSHEIRTPMTAILGFSELLKSEELSASEQRDCLDTVLRNGQHLLTLINQVLDITKIEAGKLDIEITQCDPRCMLRDIDQLLRAQAESKGIRFEIKADGELPQTIASDPTRIKQALVNLVSNAIKFTPSGKVSLVARLNDCRDYLEFEVTDTGIGMTKAQIERVFQPFLQADSSTSRKFGGTGLGLAITKQIAHLLNGDIRVESQLGAGSSFTFVIPNTPQESTATANPSAAPACPPKSLPAAEKDHESRGKVLIVDDGIDNRRLLIHVLERANFSVEFAVDGRDAYAAAIEAWQSQDPFDLVLMDLQMPVMDGYAATAKLRESGYHGQIVALTANAIQSDKDRCLNNGFDGYIPKPIDRKPFLEEISRRVLDSKKRPHSATRHDRLELAAT